MYNKIIMIGNIVRDIELKYLPSGMAIANITLASNRKWKDKQTNESREEVCYVEISIFNKGAELVNQYCRKGSKILVEGRLSLEQWVDKDTNQKRSKHKIVAENIKFLDSKEQTQQQAPQQQYQAPTQQAPQQQYQAPAIVTIDDDDIPF